MVHLLISDLCEQLFHDISAAFGVYDADNRHDDNAVPKLKDRRRKLGYGHLLTLHDLEGFFELA